MLDLTHPSAGLLKKALLGNALFSIITGVLMIVAHDQVLAWLGIDHVSLVSLGGFLLAFAAFLIFITRIRAMPSWVIWSVIIGDILWVVGSVVLLLQHSAHFSGLGITIIIGVALVVADFAIFQTIGLKRSRSTVAV